MNTRIVSATVVLVALAAVGCAPNPKSGRGFELPAGNAEKGKAAFIQLKCAECHRVTGVDLPAPTAKPELIVTLGGEVTRVRTYGQIVTAIIHPNLAISEKLLVPVPAAGSPMKDFNREMTVAQLVDIVTFLQPTYRELALPPQMGM
jgi:L-cysteine S-thiosulfotransferase